MDKLLLYVMSERTNYRLMRDTIPEDTVGSTTTWLLEWYGAYFKQNGDAQRIDYAGLSSLIRLKVPKERKEQLAAALHVVASMQDYKPNKAAVDSVVQTLHERKAAGEIGALVARYSQGEEVDVVAEVHRVAIQSMKESGNKSIFLSEDGDPVEIIRDLAADHGVKFRQRCLQENIKGLRGGDLVGFCARVDSGKTSYLADFATYAAPQVAELYPNRSILYCNNEGVTRNIIPRLYSAALNLTSAELVELEDTVLREKFLEATGGCSINLVDAHGWSMATLEQRVLVEKPAMVIIDMVENIRPTNSIGSKHEDVEQLWKDFRDMAARYDFIAVGTAQISVEGDNMLYPPGSAVKNSKTGIQTTLDVQIMMGSIDSLEHQRLRGFSTPKNKRVPVGKPSRLQAEVLFDPAKARFRDH